MESLNRLSSWNRLLHLSSWSVAIGSMAILAACGGDSSSGADDEGKGTELLEGAETDLIVDVFDDLPVCSDKREGATAYVKDEKTAYVCADGDWTADDDSSPSSSSATTEELGETDWNWNVAKECHLNPEITYGTMTDSRDNKEYKTVTIGDQVWMAENLNYADSTKTPSLKGKSWCYGDVAANCDVAGRLYTWAAAIDSVKLATDATNPLDCGFDKTCGLTGKVQGICPTGWHLPSQAEWNALFTAVGGSSTAGMALKSQSGWDNNGNGDDAFGFSALPAGDWDGTGIFSGGGNYADFWSSTENNNHHAYRMYLCFYNGTASLNYFGKYNGFSVRCLKD